MAERKLIRKEMTYTINNTTITNLVTEEVSRVAAAAYADDGTSLYDSIVIHSRDANDVSRAIKDAVDAVIKRAVDICTYIPATPALSFYAPDMDSTKETAASDEVTRAIVLGAVSVWMREKYPVRYQDYADRSAAALNNAIAMIKTRTTPTRS